MRLKSVGWVALVLAVAGGPARGAHCGACAYPAAAVAPEQCCPPVVRYRVCYQPVVEERTRVCYRPVYRTVMQECSYTVCRPVFEQHVCPEVTPVCRSVVEEYEVPRRYCT